MKFLCLMALVISNLGFSTHIENQPKTTNETWDIYVITARIGGPQLHFKVSPDETLGNLKNLILEKLGKDAQTYELGWLEQWVKVFGANKKIKETKQINHNDVYTIESKIF